MGVIFIAEVIMISVFIKLKVPYFELLEEEIDTTLILYGKLSRQTGGELKCRH